MAEDFPGWHGTTIIGVRKSGKVDWHLWNTLAFFDDGGNVVSYQSIGTDITLRKEPQPWKARSIPAISLDTGFKWPAG